jgi:hypothetical protein
MRCYEHVVTVCRCNLQGDLCLRCWTSRQLYAWQEYLFEVWVGRMPESCIRICVETAVYSGGRASNVSSARQPVDS